MKLKLTYTEVPHGGHMFSIPEAIKIEFIDTPSFKALDKYVASLKDAYRHKYKRAKKPYPLGHRYVSPNGGIKVQLYFPPKFKKIK